MAEYKPTGFVAKCRCGAITGAMDFERTDRKDANKLLGEWLSKGCTVEPRFGGTWSAQMQSCRCGSGDAAPQVAGLPEGYAVKHVEGHGFIVTDPKGSQWVAFADTPAGDFMRALLAAQPPAGQAQEQPAREQEVRKAFICTNCDGVYADSHVTKCDCMPEEQTWIEGQIIYAAHPSRSTAAQEDDPITYTVDGEVMTPFEYIDYLHGKLDAATSCKTTFRPRNEIAAMLPNGASVTNVYAAYAEGLKQAAQEAKDAARYRWLRNHPQGSSANKGGEIRFSFTVSRPEPKQWCVDTKRGAEMDAAIDAALSTAQAKEPKP